MIKAKSSNSLVVNKMQATVKDIHNKEIYKVMDAELKPGTDLEDLAYALRDKYPDCFVTVYADSKNFYCLMPKNMDRDQKLVDSGRVSMEQFMEKWYPMEPRAKKKLRDEIEMLEEQEAFERELY
jgi:hypothetical protein